ncbi:hypothetical protein EJ08DRAFT_674841 [Tothia fuscella]|uniref:Uncharacterized protein n=1 Tax=Tothia fuscella TaxID=1048955 RepID=A0A9P4P2W4_9PEZI|nr:hypothetical protein EJ08DRAFT_674841 [Tothia fuscella]
MATKIMATKIMPPPNSTISDLSELQQTLSTTQYELNYEKSSRIVDSITRDEESRKLRVKIHILTDDIEELNEQLAKEEERSDSLIEELDVERKRSDELDGNVMGLNVELRSRSRELENVKAELSAMNDISNDTVKVLREKLVLARELSNLKPELEHLRSQATSNQELLSEKLSLQRQLSTIQVELENAKRTAERAVAKAGKSNEQDVEYQSQIETLQQQLQESNKALKDSVKEVDGLKKELASVKKSAQDNNEETGSAKLQQQVEELRKDLAIERKERQRADKALEKEQANFEAQKSTLNDKIATFRAKLKSTKEQLKDTEAELLKAQEALASRPAAAEKGAKNPRKRQVTQMDPDAAIGTPGDMAPAKRGKKSSTTTMPGDKSTFSITPFLNRTTLSVAPESPTSEKDASDAEPEAPVAVDAEGTPTAAPKKTSEKAAAAGAKPREKKPLAPSTEKANRIPKTKRSTKSASTLAMVTEEQEEELPMDKPSAPEVDITTAKTSYKETTTTTTVPLIPKTKPTKSTKETTTTTTVPLIPKTKPTKSTKEKPRKSLLSFAAFTDEPAATSKKSIPKKRKLGNTTGNTSLLGGGGKALFDGKTLFDEDDDDKPAAKPIPGRGLFAGRQLGKGSLFAGSGGKKGFLQPVMAQQQEEGFSMFSPLKKDRKAAALAQSLLGNE